MLKKLFTDSCLCLLVSASLLSGCTREVSRDVGNAPPSNIKGHFWEMLFEKNQHIGLNYGMYTYVLLNQDILKDEPSEKYKELIKAIQTSTIKRSESNDAIFPDKMNIFFIPYQKNGNLNATLSKKLVNSFSMVTKDVKLRQTLSSRPGPFLISTPEPISKLKGEKDIPTLYVDLTTANIAAIKEIVAAYKKRIVTSPVTTEEEFKLLRLEILSFLLNGNDCINITKTAYSEWN